MIISASRRTDIPAFYSEWFFERIRAGAVLVANPLYPQQIRSIPLTPEQVDCLVFWTKNPRPMLSRLAELDGYPYYFHFTLNPYDRAIEVNLPKLSERIDTLLELAERLGRGRIVWRYDPIVFTAELGVDYHLEQFSFLARQIGPAVDQCMISFLDFYRKTVRNMRELQPREPQPDEIERLAGGMAAIAATDGFRIDTCCEAVDLAAYGIEHGRCIDAGRIQGLTGQPLRLRKVKAAREYCGCAPAVDIGAYNTCPHLCRYCYANTNPGQVAAQVARYDPQAPLLCGTAKSDAAVAETKVAPGPQLRLF